jgi:hypothetical protein
MAPALHAVTTAEDADVVELTACREVSDGALAGACTGLPALGSASFSGALLCEAVSSVVDAWAVGLIAWRVGNDSAGGSGSPAKDGVRRRLPAELDTCSGDAGAPSDNCPPREGARCSSPLVIGCSRCSSERLSRSCCACAWCAHVTFGLRVRTRRSAPFPDHGTDSRHGIRA